MNSKTFMITKDRNQVEKEKREYQRMKKERQNAFGKSIGENRRSEERE